METLERYVDGRFKKLFKIVNIKRKNIEQVHVFLKTLFESFWKIGLSSYLLD